MTQRSQMSIYVTETQLAKARILAAGQSQTVSGFITNRIDSLYQEIYGIDANPFQMVGLINNFTGRNTITDASGKKRRAS